MLSINLKTAASSAEPAQISLLLNERLPSHLKPPCKVNCHYAIEERDNYYLLTMTCKAELTIICQRCLQEFDYHYTNSTQLAVCSSDERAEQLMALYECVLAENNQVNLSTVITDELHLYAPTFHSPGGSCIKVESIKL